MGSKKRSKKSRKSSRGPRRSAKEIFALVMSGVGAPAHAGGGAVGMFSGTILDTLSPEDRQTLAAYLFSRCDESARDYFMALDQSLRQGRFTDPDGNPMELPEGGEKWSTIMATVIHHFGADPEKMCLAQLIGMVGQDQLASAYIEVPEVAPGKQAVKDYLWSIEKCYEGATMGREALTGFGTDDWERGVRLCRALWVHLRDARVFEVSYDDIGMLVHHGVQGWLDVSGLSTYLESREDADKLNDLSPEDHDAAWELVHEHTESVELDTSRLPFDWVFVGVGWSKFGWSWSGALKSSRLPPGLDPQEVLRVRLVGYLVGRESAVELLAIHAVGRQPYLIQNIVWQAGKGWLDDSTLNQFWLPHILERIEDHRTFTEHRPSFGIRRRFRDTARVTGKGLIPRPYYTIQLDPTRILRDQRRQEAVGPGRELSHRYDRSAHERAYVRRGPLPLAPKERKKLEGYGYRIYTLQDPTREDAKRLAIRGMKPKGTREWVAIKHRHIGHTVCGPDHLPYVPAVRVSA